LTGITACPKVSPSAKGKPLGKLRQGREVQCRIHAERSHQGKKKALKKGFYLYARNELLKPKQKHTALD